MPTETPSPLEVRLSRLPCLVVVSVCLLFLAAGLDLVFFRAVLDFQIEPENRAAYYGFLMVCFLLGGAGLIQTLWNLVRPPVLLRIDSQGVSFASGMRYQPYSVPGKFVKSAGYGLSADMTAKLNWFSLVKIELAQAPELPAAKITSIGVKYEWYTIYLPWFYRDTSGSRIIEAVDAFRGAGVWGSGRPAVL